MHPVSLFHAHSKHTSYRSGQKKHKKQNIEEQTEIGSYSSISTAWKIGDTKERMVSEKGVEYRVLRKSCRAFFFESASENRTHGRCSRSYVW